jgi:hypothetical protein
MDHRVDHGLAECLIWILRLVFPVEAANGRTDANILPQEATGLVDEFGKGPRKFFRSM